MPSYAVAGPSSAAPSAAPSYAAPSYAGQRRAGDLQRIVFVGNNWDGTIDLVKPGTFRRVAELNAIPDYDERMAEIQTDPVRLAYFNAIAQFIGEGHNQYVDDMYSTNDGRMVVVSRPSFADVVAISLATRKIVWRFKVDGQRSDHMAVSPDGTKVAVSASTANVVHVLDIQTGKELGKFPSGDSPHESVFIDGGRRILHASIGLVYTPTDEAQADTSKGDRQLEIVDAKTYKVLKQIDIRGALDRRGMTDVSDAVRPLTLSPDERYIYFQVSFFHGFMEYDRENDRISRVKHLPNLVKDMPREEYVLDSAHHGISMNTAGTRLCVAGTMDDYATVVNRSNLRRGPLLKGGLKPYWVTHSDNGRFCYISWSGSDTISKISYRTRRIVDTVKVGDHPQRVRNGFIRTALLAGLRG